MAAIRISHHGKPTLLVDLGPALGRNHDWRNMRIPIDIALSEPRRKPEPVELQPASWEKAA